MILVTGGTGFVGHEIINQLLQNGQPVRILARNPGRAKTIFHAADCEIVEGDILDKASLIAAANQVKTIIHLVGIIRETRQASFEKIHIDGTRNILEAATVNGVNRYLHMSAAGTRLHAVSRYHQTKWQAEQLVRESKLQWSIFRPSLIYGHNDEFTKTIAKAAKLSSGFMPCPFDGDTVLQPVSITEVARSFCSAIANEQALGKTYDLCGEPLTLKEIMQNICIANHLKPRLIPIPGEIVKPLAYFSDLLLPCSPISYDQAIILEENQHGDYQPAVEDLGFQPSDFNEVARSY